MWELSDRLKRLPPYLFAEIDRQKSELRRKKVKFIDLSIGDPDIGAPLGMLKILAAASGIKENQKYALDQGKDKFRKAIKKWFKKRFTVSLDEDKEILPLIGSKEGLVHFPLGVVNRGEYVIIPSPGYPGYRGAAFFAGAKVHEIGLLEKNDFLPDLSKIPVNVCNKAKLIYLNYPNNPTTSLAPLSFLKDLVKFCSKYGIILAYDNAYSEVYYDQKPHSILEVKGAKEVAVEFHSLSKTFCVTGLRVGWACGNQDLIKSLLKVKANIDSGIFGAIQEAAIWALEKEADYVSKLRKTIKDRRDYFVDSLRKSGFNNIYADSTFYVWTRIPADFKSSLDFSKYLISEKNIIATPGVGFGKHGEEFIRFALTVDKSKIKQVFKNKLI
ncbi:MAG: aminotransferase class I/II-fold pyridoxal phosphate-dependent enzyme [Candidatus Omnitrophica bacterium]|nr:aminotransferase class I/II-fold pyridoxal phosphate-dependent enzyme [Candidatus Omnitrophota bacterium]